MNREIKFEVLLNNKHFGYEQINSFGNWEWTCTELNPSNLIKWTSGVMKESTINGDIIRRQFTGLKDKNGVDIYDGDIVTGKFYSVEFGVVKWLNNRCGFYVVAQTVGTDIVNRNPFQSAFKMNCCKLEVIGNIYQHPELLK